MLEKLVTKAGKFITPFILATNLLNPVRSFAEDLKFTFSTRAGYFLPVESEILEQAYGAGPSFGGSVGASSKDGGFFLDIDYFTKEGDSFSSWRRTWVSSETSSQRTLVGILSICGTLMFGGENRSGTFGYGGVGAGVINVQETDIQESSASGFVSAEGENINDLVSASGFEYHGLLRIGKSYGNFSILGQGKYSAAEVDDMPINGVTGSIGISYRFK